MDNKLDSLRETLKHPKILFSTIYTNWKELVDTLPYKFEIGELVKNATTGKPSTIIEKNLFMFHDNNNQLSYTLCYKTSDIYYLEENELEKI
jgi:hypothetical protein